MALRLFLVLVLAGFSSHTSAYIWRWYGSNTNWQFVYSSDPQTAANGWCNNNFSWAPATGVTVSPTGTITGDCEPPWKIINFTALCIDPASIFLVNGECPVISPLKNTGQPSCPLSAGNPINIGTGNKYQLEIDYQGGGDFPLVFERAYNSDVSTFSKGLGSSSGWRHSYEHSIAVANSNLVVVYRPDGRAFSFSLVGSSWLPVADVNLQLSGSSTTGWQLTSEDGSVETYDATGKLQAIKSLGGVTQTLAYTNGLLTTITHSNGRSLTLSYDGSQRLVSLQEPSGGLYQYSYNTASGNLETVTYPDLSKKTYLYNETGKVPAGVSLPHALTGIVDENNNRFATWTYDAQGRAVSSQHAGGAESVSVSYAANSSTVTDALGTARTNSLQIVQGVVKSGGQSQPAGAGCGAAASNVGYDANGNITSRTDFNGNVSCYAYDQTRNLETARLEGLAAGSSCPANLAAYTPAANSNERKIATLWHATYRLPTQIDQAGQRQSFSYDSSGNLLQKTVADTATNQSRSWSYTYNSLGQILSEDGPRTDVADIATYSYYSDSTASHKPGDLWKMTNALGHVTTFTAYDANGRLLSLTDPNGLIIGFVYDQRGRLTQKTVDGNTSRYDYDPAGNLLKVTRPTGVFIGYTYDAAHRLTDIADALNNRIHYTLDLMGNRTKEEIFDTNGTVVKTHSRQFDALSRLQQDIGAYNQTTSYQYDANGNLTQVTDANGHATQHAYDSLNRLIRSTDALAGLTDYHYDAQDRLTQVTDANNHSTVYSYNGLGDLTQLDSPNSGISQYGYDSAGNRIGKTNAANALVSYTYDALNRITRSDGGAQFYYDENGNLGKLSRALRSGYSSNRYLKYDRAGRLTSISAKGLPHTTDNFIYYAYDADGKVEKISHSGYREVLYGFDAAGQVDSVSLHDWDDGTSAGWMYDITIPLASNITHLPFGPVKSLTYGNGKQSSRSYDLDYRETGRAVPGIMAATYGYDLSGNVESVVDNLSPSGNDRNFGYDPLDRLTSTTGVNTHAFSYDDVGNRLSSERNGAQTSYTYDLGNQKLLTLTGSQQASYQYDANGDVSQKGSRHFYQTTDHLVTAISDEVGGSLISVQGNKYDAFGYRTMKRMNNNGFISFDYDVLNGTLLDETKWSAVSFFAHSYVYLEGEPLARINYDVDSDPNQTPWPIHYYHNDRLGTPQKTTDSAGNVSWAAQIDPFGKATPTTAFITQNLRFPGQYYDEESGLHYNIARLYDPNLGRYLQSDPIGLAGGINTYTYVRNNPLNLIDPEGLEDSGLNQICAANGQRSDCTTGMRAPPIGSPMNGPLSPVGGASTVAGAAAMACPIGRGAKVANGLLTIQAGKFSASEMSAAKYLASLGKDVILRQPVGTRAGGGTSDLLVNGVNYDVYTPITSNPNRIISAIASKNSQTGGVVLDLSQTPVTAEQLGNVLQRVQGAGAANIQDIVIMGK
jgi:RHS repeat-associated protein